jgi:hypothetical protein
MSGIALLKNGKMEDKPILHFLNGRTGDTKKDLEIQCSYVYHRNQMLTSQEK